MRDADDFMRLNLESQVVNIRLEVLGMSWPPPAYIHLVGAGAFLAKSEEDLGYIAPEELKYVLKRTSYSEITDEQIANMSHVARGAEYHYLVKR